MPHLPFLFARRYLFSKKSHSVINVISGVSAFSVAIPVAAMVVLLSVFNGFEGLVRTMYRSFDPDILVLPVRGKVFETDSLPIDRIGAVEGVAAVSCTLEENALFEYRGRQSFGTVRGVDSLYGEVVSMDSIVIEGEYRLKFGDMSEAFVGQGVAFALGVRTGLNSPLSIYAPRRGKVSSLLPYGFYNKQNIFPSGVFMLEAEVDGKYVFVPLEFAQELFDYEGRVSSLSVKLAPGADLRQVQQRIADLVGPGGKALSRYQQKESFYRIMAYEKWGIYFIILLVLLIASFSLVGSLAMLIIDKRKDMRTLVTMGADGRLVRRIFLGEGMLVYLSGAVAGLLLGVGLSLAQQHFGFLTLSGETFLVDAYPVEVRAGDLLGVVVTFVVLSYLISAMTVRAMISDNALRLN